MAGLASRARCRGAAGTRAQGGQGARKLRDRPGAAVTARRPGAETRGSAMRAPLSRRNHRIAVGRSLQSCGGVARPTPESR